MESYGGNHLLTVLEYTISSTEMLRRAAWNAAHADSRGNRAATRTPGLVASKFLDIARSFEKAVECGYPAQVEKAAQHIVDALAGGNKLLVFGNGGSASDAQHLCAELVVRFQTTRRALPAIALSSDPAVLTACANDFSYADVFARQIEALGNAGDVALGITTSGRSPNVVQALRCARALGLSTVLLTGPQYGDAHEWSDIVMAAPGGNTARVQELHLASYHCICELIDKHFTNTPL